MRTDRPIRQLRTPGRRGGSRLLRHTGLALLLEDQRWTYARFDAITDRIRAALCRLKVPPGDQVALLFTNRLEMVFCYSAGSRMGAVAVPVNVRRKGPEIAYLIDHCGR